MIRYFHFFLILLSAFSLSSCSSQPELKTKEDVPSIAVKFASGLNSEGDYAGTSVLVFHKKDGIYTFHSKFAGPWSPEGRATAIIELGDYRFLFFRSQSAFTDTTPLIPDSTTPEDFQFTAKQDADGNLLPVDEIFLPTSEEADKVYHIDDRTTVSSKLSRAVSRIEIWVKRGTYDGVSFSELPYADGRTVLDNLDNLELKISGIATVLNLTGTQGNGAMNIRFSPSEADEVTTDGFAHFTGPLVFPPAENGNITVDARFSAKKDSPFPVLKGTAISALNKNNVLAVTLWITNDYKFLDIITVNRPIEAEMDGDSGIWY